MKYKIITVLLIIMLLTQNIISISYSVEEKKNCVEGNSIYVQHDEENNNIYLLNSEGDTTIVYQIIDVTYTPCKQWTSDGLYIDDLTGKISATSKENYIKVKENEVYFVKLYGIGDVYKGKNGDEYHITAPIVYFDDNNNCIGSALSSTYSKSKSGVEITIPTGTTRMYISNYNNQGITIQKKICLNEEEFNKIKEKQNEILNSLNSSYESEKEDKTLYDELDKCYITFVQDDSRPDVDRFADLFISKNVPLCFAAVAENLLNTSSNLKETRLEVALRVQNAGGEILAHNGPVITENTINDENFMYNYFAVQKQMLTNMGFDVNGIILAGGSGQIVGSSTTAKWANTLYKYSDLLGENYQNLNDYKSTYFYYRTALSNYKNDTNKIKEDIDKAIENKEWKVYYFHDAGEITEETLGETIDYINSKGKDKVEIVTYKTIYDNFAKKESFIKNDTKTYYVSSNGTSTDGTDINNPINLKTLKNKKIKSGDTILFKRGDTFFESLNLSITKMNDKNVKISSYGEGNLPTFSAYKYIKNSWEKYKDNIYRIDIKNRNNFTGYTEEVDNAYNIGFLEDDNRNKYYNKKISIDELSDNYDFYSDGTQYLYMYLDKNPYEELGNLKVVLKSNLMILHSNMDIDNIRFAYCGGHALVGTDENEENIKITNCILENIGGSYLYNNQDIRYGNGIEFYSCNAKDIIVKENIFRNIYDVAFTIQGTKGSGTNIDVYNNVFVNNTQDSEIWESETATGVVNYVFHDNVSINQGRGWGYEARTDKYAAGHILFWGYNIENTDISFNNNLVYNPRRIYFIEQTNGTDLFFKLNDYIKSDNNTYFMAEDSRIFRNYYDISEKDVFIEEYRKDTDSVFNALIIDENIMQTANVSNDITEIKNLFIKDENNTDIGNEERQICINANKSQIKKGDILEISIQLLNTDNLVYTYTGEIEYDKEVFENITSENFVVANLWENLKYNDENGKFIITNNGSNGNEEIFKLKLICKSDAEDSNTQINIKNLKTVEETKNQEKITLDVEKININIKNIYQDNKKEEVVDKEENDNNKENNIEDNKDENINKEDKKENDNNKENNTEDNKDENINKEDKKENDNNKENNIEDNKDENINKEDKKENDNNKENNTEDNKDENINKEDKKENDNNKDNTVAEKDLPQTGKKSNIFIIVFAILIILSIFIIIKYKKSTKIFLVVVLSITITSNIYSNSIKAFSNNIEKGDVNLDGKIDNEDVQILEKYLINLENLSNKQVDNLDVYEDNEINLVDLHYLIKKINNKSNDEDILPNYNFNQIKPIDSKVTYEPIVMANEKMQEYGTSGAGSQWPVTLETSKDGNLMLYGIDVAGLFKSTDHGKTWVRANSGITSNGVGMFAIDPHNTEHVATLGLSEYSTVGGIHISYDKAETWNKTFKIGIKGYRYLWDGLEFDPTSYDSNKKYSTDLYFSTPYKRDTQIRTTLTDNRPLTKLNQEEVGLYKSEDCGETFSLIINDPKVADGIIRFTADGKLYIGNQYGLFLINTSENKIENSYFENDPSIDSTKGVTGLDVVGNVLYVQTWDGIFKLENDVFIKVTNETYDARWPQFLTVSQSNPNHMVYQFRGDVNNYFTTLVNVTFDGGKTWQIASANMETTFYNVRFASREKVFIIDPSDDFNVITFGGDCILRSIDGGLNFVQASGISNMMQGGKFQFNYYNPDLIVLSAQDYTGVISKDGGKTFSKIEMDKGNFYAGFAADENTIFGFANTSWGGGTLTCTHDGGKTWTDTGLKAKYEMSSALYTSLQSITNPNILFAQEYYSKDKGYTWNEMNGCVSVFAYNYTGKKELYGANKEGNVVVSYDNGDTWNLVTKDKFCDSSVSETIYDLAYDHVNNYIYTIVRENHGSWGIERIYKYDVNTGKSIELKVPRDTERGYMRFKTIAVDPKSTSVVYIGGSGDYFMSSVGLLRSIDGGESWRVLTTANNPNYEAWATNQGGYEVCCIGIEALTGKVWLASGCYGHSKINPPYKIEQ